MFTNAHHFQTAVLTLVFYWAATVPAYEFAGGTGEPNDPYQITTAGQLIAIGADPNLLDKHFVLVNDIDLDPNLPGGQVFTQAVIAPDMDPAKDFQGMAFTGSFDGSGHTISSLMIRDDTDYLDDDGHVRLFGKLGTDHLGLFGKLGERAVVTDLGIEAADVGEWYGECHGVLAGRNEGRIAGCHVEGRVDGGARIGGLVGQNRGDIFNCRAEGRLVNGLGEVGGLVGQNRGEIFNCQAEGDLVSGLSEVGGLVGENDAGAQIVRCHATCGVWVQCYNAGGLVGLNDGYVTGSHATGDVLAVGPAVYTLGGLVGYSGAPGMIINCYAAGDISTWERNLDSGFREVGGLVGAATSSGIVNCYASGSISGSNKSGSVGGLVGRLSGWVVNAYAIGKVSAGGNGRSVGGLVGEGWDPVIVKASFWDIETSGLSQSAGGTGLTTAQMQDINTYITAGWDFVGERENGTADVWRMPQGGGYPTLTLGSDAYGPPRLTGSGTADDPYRIATPEDLGAVSRHDPFACYELTADIDLSGIIWGAAPIGCFSGRLDGAGFVISNLTMRGLRQLGLFGFLGTRAVVTNLGIEDADVIGEDEAEALGILAGYNEGHIVNCYGTGQISVGNRSRRLGGLVGTNGAYPLGTGEIADCYAIVSISAGDIIGLIGGLVGTSYMGTLIDCYAAGHISAGDKGTSLGGLVGSNSGLVSDCIATVRVSGGRQNSNLGGLAGDNTGTIVNSDASGDVCAESDCMFLGGLAGENKGTIERSHANGSVSGGEDANGLGGLVGVNAGGTITACYSASGVEGRDRSENLGGLVGSSQGAITSCYAVASVSAGAESRCLGGLAGENSSAIVACYATGSVRGGTRNLNLAGLVAHNGQGTITDCYAATRVTAGPNSSGLGGLTTGVMYGYTERCFWDIEASGLSVSGGGAGLTTLQMQDLNSFLSAGWDMIGEQANGTLDLWYMPEPGGYPLLTAFSAMFEPHPLEGAGTTEDPYRIATAQDLGAVRHHDLSACYRLVADIDLAGIVWTAPPIGDCGGVFDGGGFAISNMTIHGGGSLGLFRTLHKDAVVKNLRIEHANVVAGDNAIYVGMLAARNEGSVTACLISGTLAGGHHSACLGGLAGSNTGSIAECHTSAHIEAWYASHDLGGLVGTNRGKVSNSSARGTVRGGWGCDDLGGLIGSTRNALVVACHAAVEVTGESSNTSLGGLIGSNRDGQIKDCSATGNVAGGDNTTLLGGLAGKNTWSGTIDGCYATGDVITGAYGTSLGGLAGSNGPYGGIHNCRAAGNIRAPQSSRYLGGLVGENARGKVRYCYAVGSVPDGRNDITLGGLVGAKGIGTADDCYFLALADGGGPDNGAGLPLTAEQMKQRASFVGWDFEEVWIICEGRDYLRLRWERVDCNEP